MSVKPDPFVAIDDYELIEAAVLETARGRWFLAEHARRERAAERAQLLFSMRRLERAAEDSAEFLRFNAVANDLARKLEDVLRHLRLGAHASVEDHAAERRFIEQRLIEPRPFLK
jgi:hypothetical protein